jgi:predicted nucleotidyltransferase
MVELGTSGAIRESVSTDDGMYRMVAVARKAVGITNEVEEALDIFRTSLDREYGRRLRDLLVFGSRARGDATDESDVDVAIVLDGEIDSPVQDMLKVAGLAYDAIVETGIHVQGWPVSEREWANPSLHENPQLILSMRRDGLPLEAALGGPSHK